MPIKIDHDKCCLKGGGCTSCSCGSVCDGCIQICPVGALSRGDSLVLDSSKCIECGACINTCKNNALSFA